MSMKKRFSNQFLPRLLAAGLVLILAAQANAQLFTTLFNFAPLDPASETNSDGFASEGSLLLSDGVLYGTTFYGGAYNQGSVYAFNTNRAGFTNLHTFTGTNDGSNPQCALITSGNFLYGTTYYGGTNHSGTVFAVNTSGTVFANLHTFGARGHNSTNSDGAYPEAALILSGDTLYGTAAFGGTNGAGTIFALNLSGEPFTNLYNFTGGNDGSSPSQLILSGTTLYGTANQGGANADGTVFAVNLDGTGFAILHTFDDSDGYYPTGALLVSDNTLYGTTAGGGTGGEGTVFALNLSDGSFTNLHDFTALSAPAYDYGTNTDGAEPWAGVILSGQTLYGTAFYGGTYGNGTVFAINTNGTGFTTLHSFHAFLGVNDTNSDGGNPVGGLIFSGNTLYGTATDGGSGGTGTVFALSLTPPALQPAITLSGAKIVLTWPTNLIGFTLQSTPNLFPAAWSAVSPPPTVVNGQNVVTNPITAPHQFYRFSQ
jgi:uncharacterized repeat protein (TIGR03803 family)